MIAKSNIHAEIKIIIAKTDINAENKQINDS